jgi:hypothetical protein
METLEKQRGGETDRWRDKESGETERYVNRETESHRKRQIDRQRNGDGNMMRWRDREM